MRFVVVVGNPKPESRTLAVAVAAATAIGRALDVDAGYEIVDLCPLADRLLLARRDPEVDAALDALAAADLVLVASPTFKGTYTGLLKAFLDLLPYRGLEGAVALPLLVMNSPQHSLAVDVHLRPLLVELGASVPTPGLALLEADLPRLDGVLEQWVTRAADQLQGALMSPTMIQLGA
jgi:FMN reductase